MIIWLIIIVSRICSELQAKMRLTYVRSKITK